MTLLVKPLKSITLLGSDFLFKIRKILIGLVVIGLGVGLGFTANLSEENAWLLLSIMTLVTLVVFISNRILNGLLLLIALYPFIESWIELPMGAGLPDLSFSRFAIAFLAVFMLAQAAIGKFRFLLPIIGIVEICIIGTVVGMGVSGVLSSKPTFALQKVISGFLMPLSLYFFARQLVRDKADLHKLFWAIALLGFGVATYAIYEIFTGHILFYAGEADVESIKTSYGGSLRLLRGLLGTSPSFGRTLGFAIPIAFYLFFENKSVTRKFCLVAMIAVMFIGLFFTYNRTSWYATIISLTLMQFFYAQFRPVYLLMVFLAAIMLWATWDQVNQSEVVTERVNNKTESFNGRDIMWEAAWNMWEAKPVWGWGYGAIRKESGRFRMDGRTANFSSPQSEYLNVMVISGLVGAVPYFAFLLLPLIMSIPLFFLARRPDWSGFIKSETIAVYWAVALCFALGGYTVEVTRELVRMIPFVVAGAVVGTHQSWLRGSMLTNLFSRKQVEWLD